MKAQNKQTASLYYHLDELLMLDLALTAYIEDVELDHTITKRGMEVLGSLSIRIKQAINQLTDSRQHLYEEETLQSESSEPENPRQTASV